MEFRVACFMILTMCKISSMVTSLSEADSSYRYQGDIIVTLDNGFEATIPNELLIVPPLDIRDSGATFTNTSVREVLISPTVGSNSDNWAILGKPFFQSVYLTADYDSRTFTLSQVNHLVGVERLPREELDQSNALQNFSSKSDPLVGVLDTLGALLEHDGDKHDLKGQAENEDAQSNQRRVPELIGGSVRYSIGVRADSLHCQ